MYRRGARRVHLDTHELDRHKASALEVVALSVGLFGLGVVAHDYQDRALFQNRMKGQLEESRRALSGSHIAGPQGAGPEGAEFQGEAKATRAEARSSGLIGEIRIDRLDLAAMVAEGTDPGTLRRAVGHLPETAFPGESGNAVLAGHRDSFFRALKDVREGDRIELETPDGTFHYLVVGTTVVPPEQVEVLVPSSEPVLTLVTCYPFSYVGQAPDRFIVVAAQVPAEPEMRL